MAEHRVARFGLRWEAEFALGFLKDAGIPARLVNDGNIGSGPYTGDLNAASLLVAEQDVPAAQEALRAAGVLEDPKAMVDVPPPLLERDLPPVLRSDAQDVTEALERSRRAAYRHGMWAVLGVSPSALIPMAGLLMEGSVTLLVAFSGLVVADQLRRWWRASREANRLELLLMELVDQADGDEGDPLV